MSDNQATYPVATMCRVLGVSPSGYYAWTKRPTCQRATRDADIVMEIRQIHMASKGTYGVPRIHADLAARNIRVGRKRVARLMRAEGLTGVSRRKFVTTTVWGKDRPAPDLVDRAFTAEAPDILWPFGDASIACRLRDFRHNLLSDTDRFSLPGNRSRRFQP